MRKKKGMKPPKCVVTPVDMHLPLYVPVIEKPELKDLSEATWASSGRKGNQTNSSGASLLTEPAEARGT